MLVLGTSPALHLLPLDAVRRPILSIGVNRIWPVFQPDFILVSDEDLEEVYLPPDGALCGEFLTNPTLGRFAGRSDVRMWEYHFHPTGWNPAPTLPSPRGKPIPSSRNGAGYAVTLALSYGAAEVGVIGVDYNKAQLREQGLPDSVVVSPMARVEALDSFQLAFWNTAAGTGRVFNLSPYEDSPFNATDLPRRAFADWLEGWVSS